MEKNRLDVVLCHRGLMPSREKARAMILAGKILVNGQKIDKPGTRVPVDANIVILDGSMPYVSRGGLKLEGAIRDFGISFRGKSVLDVGASTGGFTDCALQHGAVRVVALDVGYGQLDWKLRNDERVIVHERTNIRHFTPQDLGAQVDIATIDVSFISLDKVLPGVFPLVKEGGEVLALVKPQFEAGRDKVGKKGVVKDPEVHGQVLFRVIEAAAAAGFSLQGVTYSPIKGPEGNIEYFIHLKKHPAAPGRHIPSIAEIVSEAHHKLGGIP